MATSKTLTSYQLIYMMDFANKEAEKILVRAKELNAELKTLTDKNSVEGLNILTESEQLQGKFEGINLIMDELERIAKNS